MAVPVATASNASMGRPPKLLIMPERTMQTKENSDFELIVDAAGSAGMVR